MDGKTKKTSSPPSLDFQKIAIKLYNNSKIIDKLRYWWCHYYKRPFLDPLFEQYTIEELLLEYHITQFMSNPKAIEELSKVEDAKAKGTYLDDEEWLKQQMGDDYNAEEVDINFDEK